jgi:hypothetical protein
VKRSLLIQDRMAELERRRSPKSIAISVAIHVVLITLLATVTFHYEITDVGRHDRMVPERVTFIQVAPPQAVKSGNGVQPKPSPVSKTPPPAPAPLLPPSQIPSTLPSPSAPTTPGSTSGVQGGTGGSPTGMATGVEPVLPDARVQLTPPPPSKVGRSQDRMIDSAVHAGYTRYADSVKWAQEHPNRAPGDWTTDVGGQKVGWDPDGIHLGKFTIPNALLALLHTNMKLTGENMDAINDGERQAWITQDLKSRQQGIRGMDDEDFNAMVKRIRSNADDQKQQDQQRSIGHGKDTTRTCCQQ